MDEFQEISYDYKPIIGEEIDMSFGIMNLTKIGNSGLVKIKDIPKRLKKTKIEGFIKSIKPMKKKEIKNAPNRYWIYVS